MLREGSARTAFSQGPAVPIVPKSPRNSSPGAAAPPPTLLALGLRIRA